MDLNTRAEMVLLRCSGLLRNVNKGGHNRNAGPWPQIGRM
jgi:hypothetical protein